ncbi:uncharacterized protein LOC104583560 [Brachypodium distachyon]|uniref:Mixed lineage kinase domain-containing protein n=1 Tax=Brachypodium distachyon TaxID=15368 RepID=I1I1J0_BRADI|nr:uncharacterized protein LOC104583560 [Brachypodium distachyon]KQJ95377.1 hypothetical protein BRADI_3g16850v3 [Brachypodium distachyon]|eukprot:XP_010234406.1 uncharacterized protein LOC104583560 [Brachypodium distachyon]
MEAVSTILKVAQQIAKAAETARRNRARCRELAARVQSIGDSLRRDASSAAVSAAASRTSALGRLKAALDDALQLVESCRRRQTGTGWLLALLTSGRTAAKFQRVEKRITDCGVDLGLEKLLLLAAAADRDRRPRRPGKEKGKKKDGGGNKQSSNGTDNRSNKGKKKQKDVAKNGNKNGNGGASNNKNKNKGAGGQQKGRGINAGGKLAAAARAPPGPRYVVHSMEDDPNSCSVM